MKQPEIVVTEKDEMSQAEAERFIDMILREAFAIRGLEYRAAWRRWAYRWAPTVVRLVIELADPRSTYFIAAGGRMKIGQSRDPDRRIRKLQTGSGEPFEVLAIVPHAVMSESDAHFHLNRLRIHGEWFRRDPLSEWLIFGILRDRTVALRVVTERLVAFLRRQDQPCRRLAALVEAERRIGVG